MLFIAPDSQLSLVPFAALPGHSARHGNLRHLLDDHTLSYVSSGRDLLSAEASNSATPTLPIIIADPDYDLSTQTASAAPELLGFGTAPQVEAGPFRRLAGSRAEGIEIGAALGVEPWLDDRALKSPLRRVRAPRLLHIATHGFFRASDADVSAPPFVPRDPMQRSGLALAGANTVMSGGDVPVDAGNGILYAEDVAALDLAGTDLVVLSACDSGVGDVHAGEGVFGLRRAFALAGVRALVMSLWKVDDAKTHALMTDFYRRIRAHKVPDYPAALRRAQRRLRKLHPDPSAWAAFICQTRDIQGLR